jgi:hypothetical protein
MTELWHQTENSKETKAFSSEFWKQHREDLESGRFWADRIKELQGEPAKRLSLALRNLPLPASFREGAIATRALIRERRGKNESYEDLLRLLYWLAAVSSFPVPYSERLREPGYNVIESIPGSVINNLQFSYSKLGYEELELLNKTDVKWLTENWGEPASHTTLHRLHKKVWREYEDKLVKKRNEEKKAFKEEIRLLLSDEPIESISSETPKKLNIQTAQSNGDIPFLKIIIIGTVVLICLYWLLS